MSATTLLRKLTPLPASAAGGFLFIVLQGSFPCTYLPAFSMTTGCVSGASLGAAIALLARRHWISGVLLLLVACGAGYFMLISHMCP